MNKTRRVAALICLCLMVGFGNGYAGEAPRQASKKVVQVKVLIPGKVIVNDELATLDGLRTTLAEAKQQNGEVWYYREGGSGEPPAVAREVIKLIADTQMPILLSSEPDFSTYVDEQGVPRPRKVLSE